jgi:polyisoprenoid-binding protein YceI
VWIDGRSSLHPIHSSTDGLEGYVDVELDDHGSGGTDQPPAGRLSLAVSRLESGNRLEDREMQKRIDARRYPTIEGVLAGMESIGDDGNYRVSGDVTFRGVTRRYEDDMAIGPIDPRTIRLAGAHRFDIRDFGMEPPRILMLKVEPEVEVRIEIIADREA